MAQLIAMALASDMTKSHSLRDIMVFIMKYSKAERNRVVQDMIVGNDKPWGYDDLDEYLDREDLPTQRSLLDKTAKDGFVPARITPSAACHVLSDILWPPRKGFFRFMELPFELRTMIYKMTLSYATCERLIVSRKFHDRTVGGRLHFEIPRTHGAANFLNDVHDVITDNFQGMLALLSVNKQAYAEAMPIFYESNHFAFEDVSELLKFLTGIGPERRNHLLKLSVRYDHRTCHRKQLKEVSRPAFTLLSQCSRLRRLEIRGYDEEAYLRGEADYFGRHKHPPGINDLAKMRGLESIEFEHPCPCLLLYLRPLVTRPRVLSKPRIKEKMLTSDAAADPQTQGE